MPHAFEITAVTAREILSSGGKPTVEATVTLHGGARGTASVPFGASAGKHEAFILLDQAPSRFGGGGVLKAIKNIHTIIAPELRGLDARAQAEIDAIMLRLDGTANKSHLGSNAILAVSLATARAAAHAAQRPLYQYLRQLMKWPDKQWRLPNPLMVVIEGGQHADNSTDLQEYLIAPVGKKQVAENIRMGVEVYHALKKILQAARLNTNVGNEGAYAPDGISTNTKPFDLIMSAIKLAGYAPHKDVAIGIDAAATEFYNGKKYNLAIEKRKLTAAEFIKKCDAWQKKYKLFFMEDCLAEDDWDNWVTLNKVLGKRTLVVGDDLVVTNAKRLERAIDMNAMNAMIVKPNQIGTLTETIITMAYARKHNIEMIVSHRGGGETNDTFIIDLAVAANAAYVKVGPSRGERVEKYNRLMEIAAELKK